MRSIVWLCILVTSYFYCLPLGRFQFGGFASDFRIFDFVILLFWIFNWNHLSQRLVQIYKHIKLPTRYVKYLIIIILVSLLSNFIFRGTSYLGPTLVRAYRFVAYLGTLAAVIAIVDSREKFKLLLTIFYINILIQAVLAFLQGIGLLDSFWPIYWREMYAFADAPVATLSPHHKHIGVVMLMGFCLSLALVMFNRNPIWKFAFAIIGLLMATVPLLAGTRTFLLGLAGVFISLLWVAGGRILGIAVFLIFALYVASGNLPQEVNEIALDRIEEQYQQRIVRDYERGGVAQLAVDRTVIYASIIRAIQNYPYLLITGSGFQAAAVFIHGNGAHNNFLQFLVETGIIGLFVFLLFLKSTHECLLGAGKAGRHPFESSIARFVWTGWIGLIFTMFVGETFYAQAAMFTLTGQIMVFVGLGIAPYFWQSVKTRSGVPFYR